MDSPRTILNSEEKLNDIARFCFDEVDTDKSGKIDKGELETVLNDIMTKNGGSKLSSEDLDIWMKELDTDNSGKIDFPKFKLLIKAVFQLMVKNS